MASLNKVLLMGNLTRDPEIRYTAGGAAVCNVGLAMNNRFTTASGEVREDVCFVDVEIWGKQAESIQRYKRKGETVLVEGRLKLDQWQDKQSGQNRSRLSVRAERVQFIGSSREGAPGAGQQGQPGGYGAPQQAQPAAYQQPPQPQGGYQQPYQQPQQQTPPAPQFNNQQPASMPAAPSFNNNAPAGNNAAGSTPTAPIFETIDEPEDDIPF